MTSIKATDREGVEHELQAKPGSTLMEVLRDADLGIAALCGGMCACATCHVYIDGAWISRLGERQSDETALLEDLPAYQPAQSRLSCQIRLSSELDGLTLTVAPEE